MIDLAKISGFNWDAGNVRKSEEKHGVSMAEAEQVFFNTPLSVSYTHLTLPTIYSV